MKTSHCAADTNNPLYNKVLWVTLPLTLPLAQALAEEEKLKQAGAELCQAQVKLGVIVDVVEGAWS